MEPSHKPLGVRFTSFAVLVSLPTNDLQMARAALRGGADGLKVHINVTHRVSRRVFGTWAEERAAIAAIVAESPVPVTVMAGHDVVASRADLEEMVQLGVDSIDVYTHHLTAGMLTFANRLGIVAAPSHNFSHIELAGLAAIQEIHAIEASVVDPAGYGSPLSARDLAIYHSIRRLTGKPVIVPTQRAISPEYVTYLARYGGSAVLLGGIATGQDPRGVEDVTRAFKQAAAALPVGASSR